MYPIEDDAPNPTLTFLNFSSQSLSLPMYFLLIFWHQSLECMFLKSKSIVVSLVQDSV